MYYAVIGTDLRITATLNVDITGATTKQIGYIKPGSTVISFLTASVTSATGGIIYADITNAINDTVGLWRVFPWVGQADGKIVGAPSRVFTVITKGNASTD